MVLQKYKLYMILDVGIVFVILQSFLQIIHIDRSLVITNIFRSSKNPNLLNLLAILLEFQIEFL